MRSFPVRRVLKWVFVVLAIVVAAIAATPFGRYILRAGWEEAKILARRRPIEEVIADSVTSPALRDRLRLVIDARQFGVDSLGLNAGKSFTTFAKLDRDTLVLVLSAAYRDRLEAYRWWFPIVGRLPYKGFFKTEHALRARDDFRARGFDTYLRPASAFSTLGWFNDPLLSTTVGADSSSLVNTVIHELSHNTLFVAGDAEFSESFASFIGARGADSVFRKRALNPLADEVVQDWSNDQILGSFWQATAKAIDSAFAAWPSDSAARVAARDSVFARARRQLVDSVGPLLKGVNINRLGAIQLDNAALLARRVYSRRLDLFDSVWVRNGRDVMLTIGVVQSAVRDSRDPFAAVEGLLRR